MTPESLTALVPKRRVHRSRPGDKKIIGVLAQDENDVLLVTKSPSGRWYCVTENNEDGVSYGVGHVVRPK